MSFEFSVFSFQLKVVDVLGALDALAALVFLAALDALMGWRGSVGTMGKRGKTGNLCKDDVFSSRKAGATQSRLTPVLFHCRWLLGGLRVLGEI